MAGRRKQQTTPTGQTLIVLEGGPKSAHWYWLTDWHAMVASVTAQGFRPGHPAAEALCYQPTGRYVDNPRPEYGQGEVWRYEPAPPPAPPIAPAEPVSVPDGSPTVCSDCGGPLFLRRPGRERCGLCDPDQFRRVPEQATSRVATS